MKNLKHFKELKEEVSYNIEQYFVKLDLTEEFLRNKKILDMGCRDGEFVQYLVDKKITSEAFGLDIEDSSNKELCNYELVLDNDKFLHQSYEENIELKNIDLITFKSSFYPPMVKKSFDIFRRLVKNNLSDNGEIRVEILIRNPAPKITSDNEWPLLQEWKKVLNNIDESGLNYKINEEKELLIIKK